MFNRIVTHGGAAHRDEFIAVCIAYARHGAIEAVYRREPTEAEMEDPTCLVLDVGGRMEPEKGKDIWMSYSPIRADSLQRQRPAFPLTKF